MDHSTRASCATEAPESIREGLGQDLAADFERFREEPWASAPPDNDDDIDNSEPDFAKVMRHTKAESLSEEVKRQRAGDVRWSTAQHDAESLIPDLLARMLAQKAAQEFIRSRDGTRGAEADVATLRELLCRPEAPPARIVGLMPWEASVSIVAQRKTGKTTLLLNLVRSLITGEPFLGKFTVRPIASDAVVAVLNYEVSGPQFAHWANEVGIPLDRLVVVNLRGARNPLSDDSGAAALAAELRARDVETIIVDPFGRAVGSGSQNDAADVQPWLNRLDEFARSGVGATDLVLVVHAGWNGERSRGSSALEDWPDAIWTLARDDTGAARYFRAEGRDVDVEEDLLHFDQATRRLTCTGAGDRRTARTNQRYDELAQAALAFINEEPGLKVVDVEERLRTAGKRLQKGDTSKALRLLAGDGRVEIRPGKRNARLHFPAKNDE